MAKKAKKKTTISDPLGHGQRAVDYLRSLKHPRSSLHQHAFQLDDWQEEIVRRIYGPRDKNGRRIVKTVFILVGRGNRKTSLAAALALLHTDGPEAVPASEVTLAAGDQKQAKIAFREIESIIRSGDKSVWKKGYMGKAAGKDEAFIRLREYKNQILFPNASFVEAISSDAGTQHGRTPSLAIMDEIHAWPKRELFDVIKTGLVKTPNSLAVIITTSGVGRENIAFSIYEYAKKVASGEIKDPSFLPILYEAPADCDWQDETNWHFANPGLKHGYPDIDGLRQLAREAKHRPADQRAFKQLHLNIWQDHSAAPFVDMSVYDQGNQPVDLDALRDRPCWLAADLSSTDDLTAVVAAWRDGERFIVKPWFFVPQDTLIKRTTQTGIPYTLWADQGFIIPTPGPVVDYDLVEDHIRELCRRFIVREICFDPALARRSMTILLEEGLPVIEFRQGWISMAPAIKTLERAIIGGNLIHGGHPVLRWNFENIEIEIDAAGNKKMTKGKAKDKIDGAVATAMAVARAATGEDSRSIYDDVSARPEGLLVF